jgi:hypothetical protein
MPHVLEAGTDVATVVLFDPTGLPSDFDTRWRGYPSELGKDLQQQGRMFWVETGSDGAFGLHICVDEQAPEYLQPFLKEPLQIENFLVPGGSLAFCGSEYAGRDTHNPKISKVVIPSGVYAATFYRTEYPDDMVEEAVESNIGTASARLQNTVGVLTGIGVFGSVISAVAVVASWFARWTLICLGILLSLAVVGLAILKTPRFKHIDSQSMEVQKKYPSIVAVFKKKA